MFACICAACIHTTFRGNLEYKIPEEERRRGERETDRGGEMKGKGHKDRVGTEYIYIYYIYVYICVCTYVLCTYMYVCIYTCMCMYILYTYICEVRDGGIKSMKKETGK
jgi:hypothetical protein